MQDSGADESYPDHLREIVESSHTPVLILRLPSQIVLAASPGAERLFGDSAPALVGHSLTDFTERQHAGGMQLLATRRITGYEAILVLRTTSERRRCWFSTIEDRDTPDLAIAVLLKDDPGGRVAVPVPTDDARRPVVGRTDSRLIIDRMTSEVQLLGYAAQDILGTSLLALVTVEDVPTVLSGLADCARHKQAVTRRVAVLDADDATVDCLLVLLPLLPEPSCAFALLPSDDGAGEPVDSREAADLIVRLGRSVRGDMASRAAAHPPIRPDVDLGHLTSREVEVISYLVAGDRVPAISKRLFLSEGTIRNNLSSAFAKLGVKNQQQLIELLRPAPFPHF